ncbi:MAG TPA: shikimate dehydrogenase [Candidatus Acidoferrales bacterium]|nr:shikimate dehydrogenase [Candidatus Acidoferrales bacterium]
MGRTFVSVFGADRICSVIARRSAGELLSGLRIAARESTVIELRFDWLTSLAEISRAIEMVGKEIGRRARSRGARRLCLIATLRRRAAGGEFRGSIAQQLEFLRSAISAGCEWCDLEIETAMASPRAVRELQVAGARVLVSFHDFRRTPQDLDRVARNLRRQRGDAIKIATHCQSVSDALRVLSLAHGRQDVVEVPMGDAGLAARVLALSRGSALAYASSGEASAPGQLSVSDMRGLYRVDRISKATRIFGIIGDPVKYSLSPLMHNSGYVKRGVNAVFLPFQVSDLRDFMRAASRLRLSGLSVTKPHKQTIIAYLDRCDALSARIGAINTVAFRAKKLYGYNSDYIGVLRALQRKMRLHGSSVLILGAGGAARAAVFALVQAGAEVFICARRYAKARDLAIASSANAVPRTGLRKRQFDAIINATPVGMGDDRSAPIRTDELNCRVAMDMVYSPMKTEFLRMAARRGIKTISGAEMLIAQGAAQWEIWLATRAPVKVMRNSVLRALNADERRASRHSTRELATKE